MAAKNPDLGDRHIACVSLVLGLMDRLTCSDSSLMRQRVRRISVGNKKQTQSLSHGRLPDRMPPPPARRLRLLPTAVCPPTAFAEHRPPSAARRPSVDRGPTADRRPFAARRSSARPPTADRPPTTDQPPAAEHRCSPQVSRPSQPPKLAPSQPPTDDHPKHGAAATDPITFEN